VAQEILAEKKILRILHLEDEPNDRKIIRETLSAARIDCEIVRVESQEEFIRALTHDQIDLILADYRLPSFDGLTALAVARRQKPEVPFIIVSGTLGEDAAMDCLKAGATDYVLKERLSRLPPAVYRAVREAKEQAKLRRAEEELRQSEERYRALFEDNPSMFFTVDGNGRVISVNPFGAGQLGYTIEELVGQSVLAVFHPEDQAAVVAQLKACLQHPFQVFQWQFRKVRKNGTIIWVEEFARAVSKSGGRHSVLIVCHDITERKRLEEQLSHSQKMEAIGRLAGGVAHDFNNLLTGITCYTELLASSMNNTDPRRNDVEEIKKAAERAATLTRQLLAFSRKQILTYTVVDLNAVVTSMEKMLGRLIGEDIELATRLDSGLGPVKADVGQLEQVIVNLAVNARDAMPNGGQLILETANVELNNAYTAIHPEVQTGHYVLLAVTDTGSGMDETVKANIFEPFFTTKEMGKGTGLGLATVYGIIKQSGGHITVSTAPGQGSTFQIYLPRVQEEVSAVVAETEPLLAATGQEVVLLVEDDEGLRHLISRILRKNGYTVLEASSGAEALQQCEQHAGPLHLLLSDVVMPQMSGRKLAQRLAALRPVLKVLYLSGYTDDSILRHGVMDDDVAFLQKPFTPVALTRKVREVLDQ
jgi:hypothetical protein